MTRRAAPWIALGTALVAFLATADALGRFAEYAADPHRLFQMIEHDRTGHFGFALDLALALRDLNLVEFFSQLERARVWPPLHGLTLAFVMLAGGIDLKLAIVPSLAGWAATIVLIWLIGLRLFADVRLGAVAGGIAVAFALKSPAFRLITADVMLEGLGAALGCVALYCYLRARETPDRLFWWRALAIVLTLLFFEKFNYWLLTLVPLAVAYTLDDWPRVRAILARLREAAPALAGEWRNPLTLAFLVLFAIVVAVALHGPLSVSLFGRNISLHPPNTILTIAYAFLFARLAVAWKRNRAAFEAAAGPALQQLACWLALPVAASFLIPKRLGQFLWYVGPTHHQGVGYDLWRAVPAQWSGFSSGFHVAPWAALLVLVGAALALILMRRAGPPLRAVALVALIGAAAVLLHPQQQLRFQTTVLPPLWIMAGAGWAMLIGFLIARLPRLAGGALAAAAVAALYFAQGGYPPTAKAYQASIHPPPDGVSDFEMVKAYMPYLDEARRVGFVSTGMITGFHKWTIYESCKCRKPVDNLYAPWDADRERVRAIAALWLARTEADTIVAFAEKDPPSRVGLKHEWMLGAIDALEQQNRFAKIATLQAPGFQGDITVWRRR